MRKIRDIIRLRKKGLGYRQIGRALRISHPVVSQYARDFAATGLSYAQIKGISDSELMELLAGVARDNQDENAATIRMRMSRRLAAL